MAANTISSHSPGHGEPTRVGPLAPTATGCSDTKHDRRITRILVIEYTILCSVISCHDPCHDEDPRGVMHRDIPPANIVISRSGPVPGGLRVGDLVRRDPPRVHPPHRDRRDARVPRPRADGTYRPVGGSASRPIARRGRRFGRRLGLPVEAVPSETYGPLGPIAWMTEHTAAGIEALGWEPTHPSLLEDLVARTAGGHSDGHNSSYVTPGAMPSRCGGPMSPRMRGPRYGRLGSAQWPHHGR